MRKLLVSLAAAGTVMAFATPASAQWHRPGYGYGYNNGNFAQLQRDVQSLRWSRDNLARSGRLTGREARDLNQDIGSLEYTLRRAGANGLTRREVDAMQWRIRQVRRELQHYGNNYNGPAYGRRY
ncbi:hypothetical protein [Sphingomonas sp.]|uniref:hypothetical protein n=1 Tax=Sphingomonas sp. TaxID=28214 RepID=UPI0025EFA3AF|nr:hypothetical protein [Sphingomonas sp.]MBV9527552.1 hypothetical protein [Sphingomonas sp.]